MTPQLTRRRGRTPARFPNTIREYRLRSGFTQARLARLVGRSRGVISSWECGHVLPSVPLLFKLAKALGTLAEALYADLYSPKGTEAINAQPA